MRININVNDDLLERIDKYAFENSVNRTSAICFLISSGLRGNDVQNAVVKMGEMKDMLDTMDKHQERSY